MSACKRCGSTDLETVPMATGPHHAKVTCRGCGRVTWLPKPLGPAPTPETFARIAATLDLADGHLPDLIGTSLKQIRYAEAVRPVVVARVRKGLGETTAKAAMTITDASWWIANKDRQPDQIRLRLDSSQSE